MRRQERCNSDFLGRSECRTTHRRRSYRESFCPPPLMYFVALPSGDTWYFLKNLRAIQSTGTPTNPTPSQCQLFRFVHALRRRRRARWYSRKGVYLICSCCRVRSFLSPPLRIFAATIRVGGYTLQHPVSGSSLQIWLSRAGWF